MNRKSLAFRFVQELHGAGVVISRRLAQAHCRLAQLLILFRGQRWRRRFLKNLLMAALDGAIAHAGGPRCPVVIGDDLNLDVTRALHQLLHENRGISEGLEGLGAGALEGLVKFAGRIHPTDAAASPAGRSLDQKRIAQTLGMMPGLVEGLHRPAAPGRNR